MVSEKSGASEKSGTSDPGANEGPKTGEDPGAVAFEPERILYHGHGLLVIDKPAGVPVHAGTGHETGVVDLVQRWVEENPGVVDARPGAPILPAHRLDLDASGVLVLALKSNVAASVQAALEAREVTKRYIAVLAGPVDERGEVHGKVRSRLRGQYRYLPSTLDYRRLFSDERLSLVAIEPREGRTHQIRALLAGAGRPLAGDLRYGRPKPARQFLERFGVERLLLHALELTLPASVIGHSLTVRAATPESFRRIAAQKAWDLASVGL